MAKFLIKDASTDNSVKTFTFKIRDMYEKYTFEATAKAKDVLEAKQKIKEKLIGWANMVILHVSDDKGNQYYGSKLSTFKDSKTVKDEMPKSYTLYSLYEGSYLAAGSNIGQNRIYYTPRVTSAARFDKIMADNLVKNLNKYLESIGHKGSFKVKQITEKDLGIEDSKSVKDADEPADEVIEELVSEQVEQPGQTEHYDNTAEAIARTGEVDEHNTIINYNSMIEQLNELYASSNDDKYLKAAEALKDIVNEEKEHIGEFQEVLNTINPEENVHVEEGENEVKEEGLSDECSVKDAKIKDSGITNVKVIKTAKSNLGKTYYLLQGIMNGGSTWYVVTTDRNYHGGNQYDGPGAYEVNLNNGQHTFDSWILMDNLSAKYGEKEGRKRFLAGFNDECKVNDGSIKQGTDLVSKSGNKIKIKSIDDIFLSDYDGHTVVSVTYEYETTEGKKGTDKTTLDNIYKMLQK